MTSSILINITVMLLKIKGFAKQMAFFFMHIKSPHTQEKITHSFLFVKRCIYIVT